MNQNGFHILIVDDEPNIRAGLAKGLSDEADVVDTAKDGEEAIARFERINHHLVIADLKLPGAIDGMELLRQIKQRRPETVVVVITAHGTVENAVEAMRRGAYDFVTKPVDLNLIRQQVRKALAHHRLVHENRRLRERLASSGEITEIIGNCAAMQEVFRQIRQVADTDATVLVQGESGTGKELVAQAIHNQSSRRDGPFVAVNLGALPETLLESELFGYEKGAFTGATRHKLGRFELAEGGTLFLDEVTEMLPKSQVDLLRVLEQREYRRVGGEELIRTDARLIAASNKDIRPLISHGRFREDLYYRLNVVPILVPPLRDRRDDIPLLVEYFMQHFCQRHRRELKRVAGETMQFLLGHNWPGNVRQLRNLIERLVITVEALVIDKADLPEEIRTATTDDALSLAAAVERAEKQAIIAALRHSNNHRERTAKLLGISVRNLHYRMNRYGLQ
jgi:two-component system NtrC family response regulator